MGHKHRHGFEDRWITSHDGLKLYARDYAGASGPARLPVVCIHGLTRNSRDFGDVAPYLAETGRRVLALDVRGRGRSERTPNPVDYHPGTYAKDVVSTLDQLGISRAVFVGTSMGGLITMILSTFAPERIAAAVLNDIGPVLSPVGLGRIMSYAGKAQEPPKSWKDAARYARSINEAAFPGRKDKFWKAFAERIFDEGPDGRPVLAYDPKISDAFKDAPPDRPAPDMVPVFEGLAKDRPLLLVRGAISDLLDADGAALMREKAPHMGYVEVAGVGHAPMLDEPEAKAAILRFMAGLA
mgnify:CR=1 FL=1